MHAALAGRQPGRADHANYYRLIRATQAHMHGCMHARGSRARQTACETFASSLRYCASARPARPRGPAPHHGFVTATAATATDDSIEEEEAERELPVPGWI